METIKARPDANTTILSASGHGRGLKYTSPSGSRSEVGPVHAEGVLGECKPETAGRWLRFYTSSEARSPYSTYLLWSGMVLLERRLRWLQVDTNHPSSNRRGRSPAAAHEKVRLRASGKGRRVHVLTQCADSTHVHSFVEPARFKPELPQLSPSPRPHHSSESK